MPSRRPPRKLKQWGPYHVGVTEIKDSTRVDPPLSLRGRVVAFALGVSLMVAFFTIACLVIYLIFRLITQ